MQDELQTSLDPNKAGLEIIMNENVRKYYFSAVKLISMTLLIVYFISSSEKSLHAISMEGFLLAVTMAAALCFGLFNNEYSCIRKNPDASFALRKLFSEASNKRKFIFLSIEIVLTIVLIVFYKESNSGLLLFPMVVYDIVIFFQLSFTVCLLSFVGGLLYPHDILIYLIYCFFISIIYFQNYIMIEGYRRNLQEFEQEEYQLKNSIHSQNTIYKEQLEKSSLAFENRMLEEKARLSQALHDKLGHSINGSVYQLEACKVLMEKEPEQSKKIVQGVIDNLRTSMDEIRVILRREKPDRKRMAYLQLSGLCAECKEKYGIQADMKIQGEDKNIPDLIWEVILDNSIEAVTNALKYADCTRISIEISILNKAIRCSIMDNGVGCGNIKEGMGIQGMKNRARKVNGYMDINSDNGFHINMIFPI